MTSQFYVTLFSTSSQDVYPNNTKTNFTCILPQPINLQGNWELGLVQFFHDKIIGTKNALEKPIIFETKEIEQTNFIHLLKSKINPVICTSDYWGDFKNPSFYEIDKQNSIWSDFDKENSMYRSASDELVMKVKNIVSPNDGFSFKKLGASKQLIRMGKNKTYNSLLSVLKEYLHGYIEAYYNDKQLLEQEKAKVEEKKNTAKIETITKNMNALNDGIQKLLYHKAMEIIEPLEMEARSIVPHGSHFVLIYTDVIKRHVVGNTNAKVLFMSDRGGDINSPVLVTNVQYYPIEKQYINEISVLIANDVGEQLVFGQSNPSKPTSLVLHFRKTTN